jgi:hypothetical protein
MRKARATEWLTKRYRRGQENKGRKLPCRERCSAPIGRLDDASLIAFGHSLSVVIGLAD